MRNKEHRQAYDKKYCVEHKEHIRKRMKKYRQDNAKQLQERNKKQYKKNEETMCNLKINGCAICGYNKCDRALEFHHTNQKDKKFNLSAGHINYANKTVAEELDKCILLCANCHREIHDKEKYDF